jgi:hypothetical protein
MKATLKTYYSGPTDTRGSRIVAKAFGRQVTINYDYSLNASDLHKKAAQAFAAKHSLEGVGEPIGSHDRGYCFAVNS